MKPADSRSVRFFRVVLSDLLGTKSGAKANAMQVGLMQRILADEDIFELLWKDDNDFMRVVHNFLHQSIG